MIKTMTTMSCFILKIFKCFFKNVYIHSVHKEKIVKDVEYWYIVFVFLVPIFVLWQCDVDFFQMKLKIENGSCTVDSCYLKVQGTL